ncbi:uncharacterized protein [Fopius arisanus]|uniref:Uncharacterized protein n=1 Tax=Fopius arisanus TaxID=64838 RepID=A0A9R1TQM7_9HYME|nr:PREDICTED: uncharacterized protein LOC105273014 [Fopius arisanus]XP_011313562.1 PREDICTED: uncharacterized protein LOC105273014 [Fopius arisanus]
MTTMGHPRACSNVTFVIIALAFVLTTRTSNCNDFVEGEAGKTSSANVLGDNQTKLTNGIDHQKNITLHKIDKVEQGKITKVNNKENEKPTNGGLPKERENKNLTNITMDPTVIPLAHIPSLNPGALKRAFYVFAGLSVIVLAYLMIRSFGFKKNPAQMVRKYGVLAHKQDIEMRPLPLDEDDEDDTTVFDISGLSPQRSQHQAL